MPAQLYQSSGHFLIEGSKQKEVERKSEGKRIETFNTILPFVKLSPCRWGLEFELKGHSGNAYTLLDLQFLV